MRNLPSVLVALLAIFVALLSQPALSQQIASPLYEDLSRAYGYYNGQKLSIENVQKAYPALAAEASKAHMEFELIFKSSYENIEKELQEILGQRWAEYKNQMQRQINSLRSPPVSEAQAIAFIQEVKLRAKGQIEPPVLETLLIYNAQFKINPAEEFMRGFTSTYRTKGHAKAKGIDFQIQYPKSWRAKEGQRPNVIQLITSENGRGFNSIVLMVKDIPLPPGYRIPEQEMNDLFSPQSLKEMIPDGATFVTSKAVVLDHQKGGLIVFDQTQQRVDTKISMRILQFVTVYRNKMIFVQCMTATPDSGHTELNDRFRKMEPLFKLVANSFVIQSQY